MSHNATQSQGILTWKRLLLCLAGLLVLDAIVVVWALGAGSSGLAMTEILSALMGSANNPTAEAILYRVRLPRVCFACIVGAGLSLGGVSFQALLRNPLADPYVLGISGGAALGATIALASEQVMQWTPVLGPTSMAMLGAMIALIPLYLVGRSSSSGLNTFILLLSGVMFNAFASALITLHKALVSAEKAQELLFFLMGSLAIEHLSKYVIGMCAVLVAVCTIAIYVVARDLNVMSLGDDEAKALGVRVTRVRWWVVWWASLAVAVCVAYTGLIGFVGLVIPHALRLIWGPDHRLLIPASVLAGGGTVVLCDAVARQSFMVFSTTLPVGVITALIGAPLFMVLLMRTTRGIS